MDEAPKNRARSDGMEALQADLGRRVMCTLHCTIIIFVLAACLIWLNNVKDARIACLQDREHAQECADDLADLHDDMRKMQVAAAAAVPTELHKDLKKVLAFVRDCSAAAPAQPTPHGPDLVRVAPAAVE